MHHVGVSDGKSWTNLVLSSLFVQCIFWWPQSCRKKMHAVASVGITPCSVYLVSRFASSSLTICECDAKCYELVLI
jgi:hypothetical protein